MTSLSLKSWLACLALAGFLLLQTVDIGLPGAVAPMLGITLVAVVFRFAEILPLHVTGLLVCTLLVIVGGQSTKEVFSHLFDPSVVLLFGGLVLALLLQKYRLDNRFVCAVLKSPTYRPKVFLLLIMSLSAFLSMRISNTAAAALMIPLAVQVLRSSYMSIEKKGFTAMTVIGTAYGATLGGIATLVGSPPNFLAVSALQELGIHFGFVEWSLYALPVTGVLLIVAWQLLLRLFPMDIDLVVMPDNMACTFENKHKQYLVGGIFALTVFGWLTTSRTGISSSIIALLPLFLGFSFQLLDESYLKEVNRSILLLIGSGIALGNALYVSGTAEFLTDIFMGVTTGFSSALLLLGLGLFAVLLTMFASNTASAALLLPLITPIGLQLGMPIAVVIFVGIAVSLDFTAPMGTPPNAMAYSTGLVSVRQMAKAGLLLSLLSIVVLTCVSLFVRTML